MVIEHNIYLTVTCRPGEQPYDAAIRRYREQFPDNDFYGPTGPEEGNEYRFDTPVGAPPGTGYVIVRVLGCDSHTSGDAEQQGKYK